MCGNMRKKAIKIFKKAVKRLNAEREIVYALIELHRKWIKVNSIIKKYDIYKNEKGAILFYHNIIQVCKLNAYIVDKIEITRSKDKLKRNIRFLKFKLHLSDFEKYIKQKTEEYFKEEIRLQKIVEKSVLDRSITVLNGIENLNMMFENLYKKGCVFVELIKIIEKKYLFDEIQKVKKMLLKKDKFFKQQK